MELARAIKERRSVRQYKAERVTDEQVTQLLEAARWAPSWANTQCVRYIVIRDPDVKDRLADAATENNPATACLKTCDVVIAICAELGKSGYKKGIAKTDKGATWYMFDSGLATQNIALTAHALGLGTVIIGLLDFQKAGAILGLPADMSLVALLPVGIPDQAAVAPARKELSDLVSYECYGRKTSAE